MMRIVKKLFGRQSEMDYLLSRGMTVGENSHIYSASTIDHIYPHLITIGNNVVVGAGSIVNRDLPDNGVYVGSPAKLISSIEEYRDKVHNLRKTRPDLSEIRPWDQWAEAGEEERRKMKNVLGDGVGFI